MDLSPFVFAGLWECWNQPGNGEWPHPCATIIGEPNEFVTEIHTRMPGDPAGKFHPNRGGTTNWMRGRVNDTELPISRWRNLGRKKRLSG
jgi:putative SOS response-associated peptidase YedK